MSQNTCLIRYMYRMDHTGEMQLVETIFRKHRGLFFRIALDLLHDNFAAEDVVQESLEKILRNMDTVSSLKEREVRAYCATVVKHTAIDYARKKEHELPSDEIDALLREGVPDNEEAADNHIILLQALQQLGEEDVRFLLLREDGLKYSEIAALYGNPGLRQENGRNASRGACGKSSGRWD